MVADGDFARDIATITAIEAIPTMLEVICRTTGMGFAAVARVTDDRWVACSVRDEIQFGLQPGGELQVETTICNEIRRSREPVVIDHVSKDPVYCGHHTPAMYGFESYISMPIVLRGGTFFGTLCAIDPRPARVSAPETLGMFRLFAELIAFHLEARAKLASTASDLEDARNSVERHEQFIAVLGHDLRNPLASISAAAEVIARTSGEGTAATLAAQIKRSVSRMSVLVDNVLDFTRARLGRGIRLNRRGADALRAMLEQVIAELRSSHPACSIEARLAFDDHVRCDPHRIGQLVSNLIANAIAYGAEGRPIIVEADVADDAFRLSVTNEGDPIPPETMKHLFEPFVRAATNPEREGHGLGLYICSEIARAHGGELSVSSSGGETRFTFTMPIAQG